MEKVEYQRIREVLLALEKHPLTAGVLFEVEGDTAGAIMLRVPSTLVSSSSIWVPLRISVHSTPENVLIWLHMLEARVMHLLWDSGYRSQNHEQVGSKDFLVLQLNPVGSAQSIIKLARPVDMFSILTIEEVIREKLRFLEQVARTDIPT